MEDLKKETESNPKLLNKSTETTESSSTVETTGAPPVVSCAAAVAATADVAVVTAAAPSTLLSVHVNNNNSHGNIQLTKKLSDENIKKQSSWNCESSAAVGVSFHYKHNVIDATCAGSVEDEGGGASYVDPLELKQNGSAASYTTPHVRSMTTIPEFVTSEEGTEYEAGGAASLTPPCTSQSNRTSISNSTENLSYSSDIFCPDDIILIDNGGIEGEEVSLNSDDCVYAYRGDGTDFELAMENIGGRQADAGFGDDETDFLEMDYEPDPLSEVEYETTDTNQHKNTLLMQRDACNLSGRHSANNMNAKSSPVHRQHLGSPISDLPPPKALQSQTMLGKNFARISLHLDQIKGDSGDSDGYEPGGNDEISIGKNKTADSTPSTAHSLPSILSGNFGREVVVPKETQPSPSKLTGAKPKRLSTISSTTSTKNSSKSRHSSRSFIPIPMGNTSFDDHIISCAEFRPPGNTADILLTTANNCDDANANDEACLDCLERDFLVKTIGKAIDSKECLKCRKRKKLTVPTRIEPTYTKQGRCRIGSPSMFNDEILFEKPSEFLNPRRRPEWATNFLHSNTDNKLMNIRYDMSMMKNLNESGKFNQRRTICDSFGGERLLKNAYGTEKEVVTISTVNMNEDALVQALDKLHINYDSELIKAYFRYNNSDNKPAKAYKNMKHFILHQSKKNMNHPKISRLILLATRNQVKIEYTKDANDRARQMTPLKVADVLKQWDIHKNMEILKKLDKRFIDANIIGKIGHIVRQDTAALRQLPEYVLIPQYYTPGYLTITKI